MEQFEKKFLQVVVGQFDRLAEVKKMAGGVTEQALAQALAQDLHIDPTFPETPDFFESEARMRVLNTARGLEEAGLVHFGGAIGAQTARPTAAGRSLVEQWTAEEASPAFQGRRVLRHIYELQQDFPLVQRRLGIAGHIEVDQLCKQLDIDTQTYARAVGWAIRQEYADLFSFDQATVQDGFVYITDEGMNAVENDFRSQQVGSAPTINIHDSQVYGNILASGRDNMVIASPVLAGRTEEIRSLLAEIQAVADALSNSDDRYDVLRELATIQRELSKDTPSTERIERSINVIGSLASIATAVAPHLPRLWELLR
jgi:hypothetical protein